MVEYPNPTPYTLTLTLTLTCGAVQPRGSSGGAGLLCQEPAAVPQHNVGDCIPHPGDVFVSGPL